MTADDSVKEASLSQDSLLSPAFSTSDDNEESGTVKLDADSIVVSVFIPYIRLAQALSLYRGNASCHQESHILHKASDCGIK